MTLFGFKSFGQKIDKRREGSVETRVIECSDKEEEDHQHERADSSNTFQACAEQPDETEFRYIQASEEMLQCASIAEASHIDAHIVNIEKVIAVGEVEQKKADGGEASNKRRNTGVADSYSTISTSIEKMERSVPMTSRLV